MRQKIARFAYQGRDEDRRDARKIGSRPGGDVSAQAFADDSNGRIGVRAPKGANIRGKLVRRHVDRVRAPQEAMPRPDIAREHRDGAAASLFSQGFSIIRRYPPLDALSRPADHPHHDPAYLGVFARAENDQRKRSVGTVEMLDGDGEILLVELEANALLDPPLQLPFVG